MTMIKLSEAEQEELLILYDDLYRMTSTPLWHERRQRPESKNYEIHEECYDKFKMARRIALAESGQAHYKNELTLIKKELKKSDNK